MGRDYVGAVAAALLLAGCGTGARRAELPVVPADAKAQVALGEKLFFDKRLSADGTIACSSCHDPKKGFADGRTVSVGVGGKAGRRNAPTVLNAAFQKTQFRDGRAASLEDQALGPVTDPIEMAQTPEGVERKLSADSGMQRMFEAAYGKALEDVSPVTMRRVQAAIAAYERTLVSGETGFDRYCFKGDQSAMSEAAKRGWAVFRDPAKGNCTACHLVGEKEALFSDGLFHNLGAGMDSEGNLNDLGRWEVTKKEGDRGAFRTPNLKGVAHTAPYMHDGSLRSLKEVVDFYVGGGNGNQWLDRRIKPLTHLTRQERADLLVFLEEL